MALEDGGSLELALLRFACLCFACEKMAQSKHSRTQCLCIKHSACPSTVLLLLLTLRRVR